MINIECKECGHIMKSTNNYDIHLHLEVENLKRLLQEREEQIIRMESHILSEANKYPNGELVALQEDLSSWKDKYQRLYEAQRRLQKVNQSLEDKLLKIVDSCERDKGALTIDVAVLSQKLAEANYSNKKLTDCNERYKNDVALAIQFLQCKQSNYVAHKFENLPQEVQAQVTAYMSSKKKTDETKTHMEPKSIKVPISTFPPTAMFYSVGEKSDTEKENIDIVSAAIMAKILEERHKEKISLKHCDTCTCAKKTEVVENEAETDKFKTTGVQTDIQPFVDNFKTTTSQNFHSVKLLKDDLPTKVPNFGCDSDFSSNIAKVQPNNCLANIFTDTSQTEPKTAENLVRIKSFNYTSEIKPIQAVKYFNINEKSPDFLESIDSSRANKAFPKMHHLSSSSKIIKKTAIVNSEKLKNTHSTLSEKILAQSISNISVPHCSNAHFAKSPFATSPSSSVPKTVDSSLPNNVTIVDEPKISNVNSEYAKMEEHVKDFLFGKLNLIDSPPGAVKNS